MNFSDFDSALQGASQFKKRKRNNGLERSWDVKQQEEASLSLMERHFLDRNKIYRKSIYVGSIGNLNGIGGVRRSTTKLDSKTIVPKNN